MEQEDFYLRCDCREPEHIIIFTKEDDDSLYPPMMYIHYHLTQVGILKRIKNAVLYIFGKRSAHGDFGEMVLTKNHVDELKKFLDKF